MAHLSQAQINAGRSAEAEVKWHLDRCIQNSKNYRVFHNLVIPDPKSASPCQIDHLIAGRFFNFLVFETKSTRGGCHLNTGNGVWGRFDNGKRVPMASPIEQNKRHIDCLRELLLTKGPLPSRLGFKLKPDFANWILVEPGADVPLKHEEAWLVQRDALETSINRFVDAVGASSMLKLISADEFEAISRFLGQFEQKSESGGSTPPLPRSEISVASATACEQCRTPVEEKVVNYCRLKQKEMGGRILCRDCQGKESDVMTCSGCGAILSQKEVAFCRLKRKGMVHRYVCRKCQ